MARRLVKQQPKTQEEIALDAIRIDQATEVMSPMSAYQSPDAMMSAKELIEDKAIDQKMDNFPLDIIASKSLKLSFIDNKTAQYLRNLFEAEVIKYLRSLPPNMHTVTTYQKVGNARMIFEVNLNRARGTTNRDTINERTAQVSQIKQIITSGTTTAKRGIFKRLFGVK